MELTFDEAVTHSSTPLSAGYPSGAFFLLRHPVVDAMGSIGLRTRDDARRRSIPGLSIRRLSIRRLSIPRLSING